MMKSILSGRNRLANLGGAANLFKFEQYIELDSDVLDFGCGGGYLLKHLKTSGRKVGVEINPVARNMAKENGIECVESIQDVASDSVDVLISNHALEHVENPAFYIKEFKRVIRNGGKLVIVVPHEIKETVNKDDINMHLYTWSPQNLFNLLKSCGIKDISCERICHAWMPNFLEIQKKVGWEKFHKRCVKFAEKSKSYQTRAVGIVEKSENKQRGKGL